MYLLLHYWLVLERNGYGGCGEVKRVIEWDSEEEIEERGRRVEEVEKVEKKGIGESSRVGQRENIGRTKTVRAYGGGSERV